MMTHNSWPAPGARIGDYELLGAFARGESCVFQLARRVGEVEARGFARARSQASEPSSRAGPRASTALRALKLPLEEHAQEAALVSELVAEAQLLACIQHPNIVAVHGFGREQGGHVVLDYVEGDDFRSLQTPTTRTDARVAAAIVADILAGLDALHTGIDELGQPLGAVHQAPHARHMLIGSDGRARLIDLSHVRLARSGADSGSRADSADPRASAQRRANRLHAAAMAPEQVLAPAQVDLRTDLFVVATTLWEALTGQRLFAAATPQLTRQQLLSRSIPPPSARGPQLLVAFDELCLRALARDPHDRWSSASEMREALLLAARSVGGVASASEVASWVSARATPQLEARRALLARVRETPVGAEAKKTTMSEHCVASSRDSSRPPFRPMRPPSSRPPAAAPSPPIEKPPVPSPGVRTLRPIVVASAHDKPAQAPADATASKFYSRADAPASTSGAEPRASTSSSRAEPRASTSSSRAEPRASTSPPPLHGSAPRGRPEAAQTAQATPAVSAASDGRRAPSPGGLGESSPGPVGPPPAVQPDPARPSPKPAQPHAAAGLGSPADPPASTKAPQYPEEALSVQQAIWTSAVAVLLILVGESLLRAWFGSPYGPPEARRVEQASATQSQGP